MSVTAPDNNKGFTIVEVLFVLAIAGFIMLIIFLAIPTLQRNNRNSQRKHDIADILSTASHYELSNSGALPADNAMRSDFAKQLETTYYDSSLVTTGSPSGPGIYLNFYGDATTGAAAPDPVTTSVDTVVVANYRLCDDSAANKSSSSGAGYNDIVAIFAIETAGSTEMLCQSL